jgi:ABC-type protease/lipase transport system fused ATPase/permease subunit
MSSYAFTRGVTIFAVGFLLLNAALLFIVDRYILATVFTGAAVLVVIGWFWYRRVMRELDRDRKEMKREVESLRDLLHTHHLN